MKQSITTQKPRQIEPDQNTMIGTSSPSSCQELSPRELPLNTRTGRNGKHYGKTTLVDADIYDQICDWACYTTGRYVLVSTPQGVIELHNYIMSPPKGYIVDHADGNPLNNSRANLRICTQHENMHNRRRNTKSSSQYKGVSRHNQMPHKWVVHIRVDGKVRHVGLFDDEEDAAHAYDEAARHYYGEFACVNFPSPGERSAA